jgi:hypothetical protein
VTTEPSFHFDWLDVGAPSLSGYSISGSHGWRGGGEQTINERLGAGRPVNTQRAPRFELHPQTDDRKHACRVVKVQVTQEHGAQRAHAKIRFGKLRPPRRRRHR